MVRLIATDRIICSIYKLIWSYSSHLMPNQLHSNKFNRIENVKLSLKSYRLKPHHFSCYYLERANSEQSRDWKEQNQRSLKFLAISFLTWIAMKFWFFFLFCSSSLLTIHTVKHTRHVFGVRLRWLKRLGCFFFHRLFPFIFLHFMLLLLFFFSYRSLSCAFIITTDNRTNVRLWLPTN